MRHSRTGPYRSRSGILLGVCRGLADHLGVSVLGVRVIVVVLFFLTGIWPVVGLYVLAALLMRPEPAVPFRNADDEEFYNSFASSRSTALNRLKRTHDHLERRLRRLEDAVTARDFDWERRFKEKPRT